MNGFLGTSASARSDLALLLIILLGAVALFGFTRARRRRFSAHCPVMAVAALLNWLPVLLVMIPSWIGVVTGAKTLATGPFANLPVFHGVLGGITQLLMTYTVTHMYWIERLPPERPIWLMRTTLTLWLLTLIGGITVYVVSYVI
jgi:uncharacterized membrane protein YozB (DUF420 family)